MLLSVFPLSIFCHTETETQEYFKILHYKIKATEDRQRRKDRDRETDKAAVKDRDFQ